MTPSRKALRASVTSLEIDDNLQIRVWDDNLSKVLAGFDEQFRTDIDYVKNTIRHYKEERAQESPTMSANRDRFFEASASNRQDRPKPGCGETAQRKQKQNSFYHITKRHSGTFVAFVRWRLSTDDVRSTRLNPPQSRLIGSLVGGVDVRIISLTLTFPPSSVLPQCTYLCNK